MFQDSAFNAVKRFFGHQNQVISSDVESLHELVVHHCIRAARRLHVTCDFKHRCVIRSVWLILVHGIKEDDVTRVFLLIPLPHDKQAFITCMTYLERSWDMAKAQVLCNLLSCWIVDESSAVCSVQRNFFFEVLHNAFFVEHAASQFHCTLEVTHNGITELQILNDVAVGIAFLCNLLRGRKSETVTSFHLCNVSLITEGGAIGSAVTYFLNIEASEHGFSGSHLRGRPENTFVSFTIINEAIQQNEVEHDWVNVIAYRDNRKVLPYIWVAAAEHAEYTIL
ncbi:hypothetical protein D3C85_465890 [compost metagenome]